MENRIAELEKALAADEALAAKFKEVLESDDVQGLGSDSEALAKAAAAVGIEVSPAEIERGVAQLQELSEDDLEAVAGGIWDTGSAGDGHDGYCFTIYHCLTVLMHTSGDPEGCVLDYGNNPTTDRESCWSDWSCVWANNERQR